MANTITYSENLQGWTSFHSFEPDWMAGMNNDFYTFKNGKVWKHHSNATRNNYYGTQYSSVMQTVFNVEADSPKMFKTLKLKGKSDLPWEASIVSDLHSGNILEAGYEKKEGNWYGYIRRDSNEIDLTFLSNKSIGIVQSTATIGSVVQITVSGDVTSKLQPKTTTPVARDNGDLLFAADVTGSTINSVGSVLGQVQSAVYSDVTDLTVIEMVVVGGVGPTPPPIGDLLMSTKNTIAESYGLRGAYMDVTLTNSETDEVELLTVASEVFKSYQ